MILMNNVYKCDLELGRDIRMKPAVLYRVLDKMPHLACLITGKTIMYINKDISESMSDDLTAYITNNATELVHERILDGLSFLIHTIDLDNELTLIILVKRGDISPTLDTLTQIPNRDCFESMIRKVLDKSRVDDTIMSLLFLDLDGFKVINDTYGHDEGDVLLRVVADRISRSIRANDLCFRLGGDEFAVILRNVKDRLHPCLIARRLIHTISAPVALSGSISAKVGCSIGIASYPFDAEDPDVLLKNSDEAMYRAKKLGKNNYQLCGQ